MSHDNLGDRMKTFENAFRHPLPIRMPVMLRLDGKNFHSYTKNCKKPIDENLVHVMNETGKYLCANIQGAQIGYIQSDELSILINNYQEHDTQPVFKNSIQKMVSITAGMASAYFSMHSGLIFNGTPKLATFDSRAFILPKEEVNNCFLFRQQDATRNSIQMLARSMYSHKECNNKNQSQLQELIFQKGINWNDCPTWQKRGRCIIKKQVEGSTVNKKTNETVLFTRSEWMVDENIPIFSQDTNYIEQYL